MYLRITWGNFKTYNESSLPRSFKLHVWGGALAFFKAPRWFLGASFVAHMVKSLPAMWETQVGFLGQEDPLEKEMATHSSILVWKNPMDGGAWRATVHGVTKSQT